jgi:hypothetical protein
MTRGARLQGARSAGAFVVLAAAMLLTALSGQGEIARAQEGDTLLRIEVPSEDGPFAEGDELEARVMLDDVSHLSAFEFTLEFDPDLLSYERLEGQGELLKSVPRGEDAFCPEPIVGSGQVTVVCTSVGPPLCLEGLPGAEGSGLLAAAVFRAKGGGQATLDIQNSILLLDDVVPCNLEEGQTQDIGHRVEGARILIEGDGGSSGPPWPLIIALGAVVAAVAVGAGGYLWWQRRGGTAI